MGSTQIVEDGPAKATGENAKDVAIRVPRRSAADPC
jgi:hypothetical protein